MVQTLSEFYFSLGEPGEFPDINTFTHYQEELYLQYYNKYLVAYCILFKLIKFSEGEADYSLDFIKNQIEMMMKYKKYLFEIIKNSLDHQITQYCLDQTNIQKFLDETIYYNDLYEKIITNRNEKKFIKYPLFNKKVEQEAEDNFEIIIKNWKNEKEIVELISPQNPKKRKLEELYEEEYFSE